MADADVAITAGTGTKVDTRTVGAGTDEHRQVVVLGDPTTATGVAPVDATEGLRVNLLGPSTGTYTSVAANVTVNTTILAANAARNGATVFNDSASATLFLGLSATAESATAYSVKVAPGGYYEVPFGFTGKLAGHWSAAVGSARITEYT